MVGITVAVEVTSAAVIMEAVVIMEVAVTEVAATGAEVIMEAGATEAVATWWRWTRGRTWTSLTRFNSSNCPTEGSSYSVP